MKVLIAIKGVLDYNNPFEFSINKNNINIKNKQIIINPFDEIAIEEAIRLKEKGFIKEVIGISCGNIFNEEILKKSMAFGIDKTILVNTSDIKLQPLIVAKILKYFVKKLSPNIIFLGKQNIDDDNCQTGQILSSMLNWPQSTCVSKIELKKNEIITTRETDDGSEIKLCKLPVVLTVDLRLNEPRYNNLIDIIKARKKPVEVININDLNLDINSLLLVKKYSLIKKNINKVKFICIDDFIKKIK